MRRLTVHFRNAPFETYTTKNGKKQEKIFNTVAIKVNSDEAISNALDNLRYQGRIITKHYVSFI